MTLPDTASVGDSGHVTDHNLIVDELERLETDKLDVATATGTYLTQAAAATTYSPLSDASSLVIFPVAVILGAPAVGLVNRTAAWYMDQTAVEDVGGPVTLPSSWATAHVDIYWCNTGGGAGNVTWRFDLSAVTAGVATPDPATGTAVVGTAGLSGIVVVTRLATGLAVPDGLAAYEVIRLGNDAGDTLPNDAGLIAVVFTKAS